MWVKKDSGTAPKFALHFTHVVAVLCVGLLVLQWIKYKDPIVLMMIAPFFWLGAGRGKKPPALMILATIPTLVFVAASHIKAHLVGLPLLANDRFFLRENLVILASNDRLVTIALAVSLVLLVLYFRFILKGKGSYTRFELIGSGVALVGFIYCSASLWHVYKTPKQVSHHVNHARPSVRVFAYSFLLADAQLLLPESMKNAGEAVETALVPPNGRSPDIIAILEESTFAPSFLEPSRREKVLFASEAGGTLNVHTFGGGTWLSEFSFITQLRPQEFGAGHLYVFQLLEGRIKRSMFSILKTLGYKTIVIYPVKGAFVSAQSFYTSLGADVFLQPSDMGLGNGTDFSLPDSSLFTKAVEQAQRAGDQPVAIFMLTIRQHYPYDLVNPWADYLARYEASDAAYGELIEKLKQTGRPTGLIAFGDHQPPFMAAYDAKKYPRNQTNYDIRCVNFICQPTSLPKSSNKMLDITLLLPEALERFGFGLDGFSQFQRRVFGSCLHDITTCTEGKRLEFNAAFSKYLAGASPPRKP